MNRGEEADVKMWVLKHAEELPATASVAAYKLGRVQGGSRCGGIKQWRGLLRTRGCAVWRAMQDVACDGSVHQGT